MRIIRPYKEYFTEKNISDYADMLKDAVAARSYGSSRGWFVGSDGTHEWMIMAGWPTKEHLEMRLVVVEGDPYSSHAVYKETGTDLDYLPEYIDEAAPKSVIVEQVKEMIDRFLDICGCEEEQMPELEAG